MNWLIDIDGNRILANDERETILAHLSGTCRNPEVMATARLIAAAPDLLAACEALLAEVTTPSERWIEGSAINRARAAIARAKEQA